jgi:hypothetical protein
MTQVTDDVIKVFDSLASQKTWENRISRKSIGSLMASWQGNARYRNCSRPR